MKDIVLTLQIIISVILVILVLIQSKGGGLGSAFGGSSQVYRSKRGVEKVINYLTIVIVIAFFLISILQVFTSR